MSNRPNRKPSSAASRKVAARPSADEPPSRVPLIVGLGVLLVVILLGVAFFVTRSSNSTPTSTATRDFGSVTVSGSPLPQMPQNGGTDPAIGMKAPTVTSQTFDNKEITLPQPGKPAVIAFVAHWCPHCQKEVPLLAKYLNDRGLPNDVNLYTVSTSAGEDKPNFPPSAWLAKEKWPVQTVADDAKNQAATAYGLSSFPYFVAVDANGNVVARTSGELTEQEFQSLIDQAKTPAATGTTIASATAR